MHHIRIAKLLRDLADEFENCHFDIPFEPDAPKQEKEPSKIKLTDVQQIAVKLLSNQKREQVKEILASYNVAKVSAIAPEDLEEAYSRFLLMAEGYGIV
jgi:hypothetical protein